MTKELLNQIVGARSSKIFGRYFFSCDGQVGRPSSIIIPQERCTFLELEADGCGGIRTGFAILDRLFFDTDLGFSFIAPIALTLDGALVGTERIESVDITTDLNSSIMRLDLDDNRFLKIRFEDDEMYVDLESVVK